MKKIYLFSNNVFKNDFGRKFFSFCLLRNLKLVKFLFFHLWYKILCIFKIISKEKYLEKYYLFLKEIDYKKYSALFWEKYEKKLNTTLIKKDDIFIDEAPQFLFEKLSLNIIGNGKKFKTKDDLFLENYDKKTEIYLNRYNRKFKDKNLKIKIGKNYYSYGKEYFKKIILTYLMYILLIGILSVLVSIVSLYFSTGEFKLGMFKYYFQSKKILFLNTIPIFLLMTLFVLLFNSLGIGFIITAGITIILTFVNYFKIIFRNDPFVYLDITLASEAGEMLNTYTLSFPIMFFVVVFVIFLVAILLLKYFKTKIDFKFLRFSLLISVLLVSSVCYFKVLLNDNIYSSIIPGPGVNTNSQTHNFVTRGFVYPFIYSTKSKGLEKPVDYSEKSVKKIIDNYEYFDIDEDKKVHIMSVMLESFADFTEIEEFEFKEDIYKPWHNLEKESYHGKIITSIFAGGTINTERKFLTGYTTEPNPRGPMNSYVHYLNEQGYVTRGMHPGFSWFYNRVNVNEYLGFQDYDFWGDLDRIELSDEYLWNSFANDKYVFEDMLNSYEKAKKDNKYFFNFSVTYQNHGPQKADYEGKEYIVKKSSYDEGAYNATNYYFDGINNTIKEIMNLKKKLESEDEPIVLILFGDHKPELGANRGGFSMLNVNLDTSTEEGLINFYQTPYVIWANDEAKKVLKNDFKGEGPTISPNYLMNEFFKLAGYKGNEYMQYTNKLEENISVIQKETFMEDGKFTKTLSEENDKKYKEFLNIEYYFFTTSYKKINY